MSTDLKSMISQLRMLSQQLLQRCATAEARNTDLEVALASRDARIAELEQQLRDVTSRYQNLQCGLAQGTDPQQIAALKERYLAMVSEIDDCIERLQNG